MTRAAFIAAKRAEVDSLETLALELLAKHPAPNEWPMEGSAEEAAELEWRELAHASRQLRPLLEAVERANAKEPDFEKYKDGFDFRLTEAITTVATLCAHGRLHSIRQREKANKPRPGAESPFTAFFKGRLRRNPHASNKDIEDALIDDARDGNGDFELSDDESTILTVESPQRRLKVLGISSAVSKVRTSLDTRQQK